VAWVGGLAIFWTVAQIVLREGAMWITVSFFGELSEHPRIWSVFEKLGLAGGNALLLLAQALIGGLVAAAVLWIACRFAGAPQLAWTGVLLGQIVGWMGSVSLRYSLAAVMRSPALTPDFLLQDVAFGAAAVLGALLGAKWGRALRSHPSNQGIERTPSALD
jgi:hypothetical protein